MSIYKHLYIFNTEGLLLILILGWLCCKYLLAESDAYCSERNNLIGADKDVFKMADVKVYDTAMLACHYCNEKDDGLAKVWYRQDLLLLKEPEEVQPDMETDPSLNRVYITPDHTLVVHNITPADAGVYYCYSVDEHLNLSYALDVVESDVEPIIGNLAEWRQYQNSTLMTINELFYHFNITLLTEWELWGPCVICNRLQGERRRFGRCRVRQEKQSMVQLSCHSSLLAALYPNITNVTYTVPEFIHAEKCAGVCTVEKKAMKLKKRRRYLVSQGTHFSLVCPGATLETVITWLKDGELVTSENEPHITIDIFGTLHVAEVSREDEGNYTCFVDNNRVQDAILLTITQTDLFKEGLLRHMAYLGSIFVLSFTCYCAGCFVAWTRRHHFIGYNRISQEEDGD